MKGIVKKVKITGTKTVKAGKSLKLKANVTATKKANKKLQWTSSNTKYATVNAKGVVKTKKTAKRKDIFMGIQNLTGAGRATLKAKLIPLGEVRAPQVNIKETSITVASPRLDAVAGEIFSLSRSAAAQAIASGAVTVNDEQVLKADRRLSPKDKIVLRGKGRAILGEEFTQTKKGRVRIGVKKSV